MGIFGKARADQMPDDMTAQYNSPLTPEQLLAYLRWKQSLPGDLQNTRDYDLQGAFLDQASPSANAHLTDKFKKPNHPTFSTGSIYSTPQAPGGQWIQQGQSWAFQPTDQNFRHQTPDMLAAYFRQVEPGSQLLPVRKK